MKPFSERRLDRYINFFSYAFTISALLVTAFWFLAGLTKRHWFVYPISVLLLAAYFFVWYLYWQSRPRGKQRTQYPYEIFWIHVGYIIPLASLPLSFVISGRWELWMLVSSLAAWFCGILAGLLLDPNNPKPKQSSRCPQRPKRNPRP